MPQMVHPPKDSLGDANTCRCFDSCQCSHTSKISTFFSQDSHISELKTGDHGANSVQHEELAESPPRGRPSSPSSPLKEIDPKSTLSSIIKETETLLAGKKVWGLALLRSLPRQKNVHN